MWSVHAIKVVRIFRSLAHQSTVKLPLRHTFGHTLMQDVIILTSYLHNNEERILILFPVEDRHNRSNLLFGCSKDTAQTAEAKLEEIAIAKQRNRWLMADGCWTRWLMADGC